MTPSERLFVGLFGTAFLSAVLSTPFLGLWPILACILGLLLLGAVAKVVGSRRMESDRTRPARSRRKQM